MLNTKEKVKILIVASVVRTHINTFHLPYLKWFQENGFETHVAAKNDFDNPKDCVIPFCDHFHQVDFCRSPLAWENINALKTLSKIINENEFKIIHCHTPVASALTRIVSIKKRRKGSKLVYTAHGFHFYKNSSLISWMTYYPIEKILSRLTDVIITINNEDYNLATRKFSCRIENIFGVGVDVKSITSKIPDKQRYMDQLNIPRDAKILISIGELNENKNHEVIIRAMSKLVKELNIHYVICGTGHLEKYYRKLTSELGISDIVHFLGYRRDIVELLKISDLFVFPSKREGLPVSVMEAISTRIPVLVSNIRGSKELVKDYQKGFICYTNKTDEYVDTIQEILNQKFLAGVDDEIMLRFDKNEILRRYTEIYRDLLI